MADMGATDSVLRFFIVGAPKAATTWLASALDTHDQVHMSPVKEPHFFAPPQDRYSKTTTVTDRNVWQHLEYKHRIHMGWIRDKANYERLLTGPLGALAAGEATVAYLHSVAAPRAIAESHPDARAIIMIREPIARALSHLRMDAVEGLVAAPEERLLRQELELALRGGVDATRYVGCSLYARAIERYFENLGRMNVLVVKFDDVHERPADVLREVAAFLRVDPGRFCLDAGVSRNEAGNSRWPRLNYWLAQSGAKDLIRRVAPERVIAQGKRLFYRPAARVELSTKLLSELKAFFAADIREVESLTGIDLSEWRR
jgi:hypothetical protein